MIKKQDNWQGLTHEQVRSSREKYGANVLTPPHRKSMWLLFLEKFQDPIIRILLVAAFLSLAIGISHQEFAETIGIFCAIFLSVGVGFWFEYRASKKFEILNQVNDDTPYRVIRQGRTLQIAKKDIVVGDVVMVETGEEVPADGVLLEATSLQVDESNLTGEPSAEKTTHPEYFDDDATYPSNALMRGTKVLDGYALMRVERVGDSTEYGKVAHKASEISTEETPLNIQLHDLAKLIGLVGLSLSVLTFVVLLSRDIWIEQITHSFSQTYTLVVLLGVVAILSAKIWLPIMTDGVELLKKTTCSRLRRWMSKGVFFWLSMAGIFTLAAFSLGWLMYRVDPLEPGSWLSLDSAAVVLQHFMVAVTLIVVAVPEGLPMSVTLSLAMSMIRMFKTNNLVRKMHACETMGAITVICTDKTGTLTQNQMTVAHAVLYDQENTEQEQSPCTISEVVSNNIAINSTAHLEYPDGQEPTPLGNPTEGALLMWLHHQGVNYQEKRTDREVIEQLTFSTERKYMATVIYCPTLQRRILLVKGAPEILLELSTSVAQPSGGMVDKSTKQEIISRQLEAFQSQAMRTLALAHCFLPEDEQSAFQDGVIKSLPLVFDAIFAISDPIREEVPQAVKECLEAGIKVKMITGDTLATATEIGKQIGIIDTQTPEEALITGVEFSHLSDQEALKRCDTIRVMCRARPTDKQRLVKLLQQRGEVVAVTGDGTNDAPALNHANVGLSMGSGTDVAKEASDITLLDDSFQSIATAVMWGRSLYQNIQRFIYFQLTINVVALLLVFLGSLLGKELPLTITQMLWVNLIMDTFAAAALASLPPERGVMRAKPRKPGVFIVSGLMMRYIFLYGTVFIVALLLLLYCWGGSSEGISTYHLSMFFTIFVLLQFWNLFNAKAFLSYRSAFSGMSTSFVVVALLILAGQYLIVTFGGEVFRTVPLSWQDWLLIILSTSVVLWVGELARWLKRVKQRS